MIVVRYEWSYMVNMVSAVSIRARAGAPAPARRISAITQPTMLTMSDLMKHLERERDLTEHGRRPGRLNGLHIPV